MLTNFGETCCHLPSWERFLWQHTGYSGRMTHRHELFSHVSRSSASRRKCLTVCGWLKYFRTDQKAILTFGLDLALSMSMWHEYDLARCFLLEHVAMLLRDLLFSDNPDIPDQRASHPCAAPWLQIPPPVNWDLFKLLFESTFQLEHWKTR